MKTVTVLALCVLTLVGLGPPADAASLGSDPVPTPDPTVEASACATALGGRQLACVHVAADSDGRAQGSVCGYDHVLGLFGWGFQDELVCVETTEDWGYVSGPGVCERTFGLDEPQVCVNGRDRCALWVMGVRIVCERDPEEG